MGNRPLIGGLFFCLFDEKFGKKQHFDVSISLQRMIKRDIVFSLKLND